MKKFIVFLTVLLIVGTCFGANTPNKGYKKGTANFGLPFAGTSTQRDAVPSGVWTIRDGDLWYDTTGNTWFYYEAAAWNAWTGGGGTTLTGAYNFGGAGVGRTITANDGVVQITTTDADAGTLALTHSGNTTGQVLLITKSGAGDMPCIEFENTGGGFDVEGTGALWSVSKAGAAIFATLAPTGVTTFVTDVTFDASDAGKDVEWDDSSETFHFLDNAVLGLGGATTAVGDITFLHNGTNLLVEGATQDNTPIHFGSTNAFDIVFYDNAATGTATFNSGEATVNFNAYDILMEDGDIIAFGDSDDFTMTATNQAMTLQTLTTDETSAWNFGADTDGSDVKMFGGTTGAFVVWDASADDFVFDGASSLEIGQAAVIQFIDDADGLVDWTQSLVTDEILTFIPSETDGTSSYNVGDATNTSDVRFFGETASTVIFDATADEVLFDAYDIGMQDGDLINWGDSDDFTMTGTNQAFTFGTLTSDETSAWNFGADTDGDDVKIFGATTGEYWLFDASADSLLPVLGNYLFTGTDAEANQFKVDATGTVAGIAIQLETTDGGVHVDADGAANGDITLDAADILTLTSADVKVFDGAAAETWTIEGTANGFETTVIFTDPTADGNINFPDTGDEGAAGGEVAWIADAGSATKDGTNAALPVTDALVLGTSTAASAWSLPNGEEGQILTVVIVTDGGEATITPDTANASWATVVLTDDIDGVTFQYIDDTIGWMIIGTSSDGTNLVAVTQ